MLGPRVKKSIIAQSKNRLAWMLQQIETNAIVKNRQNIALYQTYTMRVSH